MNTSTWRTVLAGVVFALHGLILVVTLWYDEWLYKLPFALVIACIITAVAIRSNTPQRPFWQSVSWSLLWGSVYFLTLAAFILIGILLSRL